MINLLLISLFTFVVVTTIVGIICMLYVICTVIGFWGVIGLVTSVLVFSWVVWEYCYP